jgi:prepilin-type N-terminal cleavage/methylation domain-containing protein
LIRAIARRGRRRTAHDADCGLSLVEVVVSLTVFALLATAVLVMMLNSLRTSRSNRGRVAAANLAAREIEIVRGQFTSPALGPKTVELGQVLDPHPLPGGEAGQPLVVDQTPYTVTRMAEWQSQDATSSPCDGGASGQLAYLHVTVTVTWPRMDGVTPVTSSTLLTPPLGTYDSGTGHVKVKVTDALGAPEANQRVTLAPGDSQTTGTDGCAFFAFLSPGTYTASLSTPGYVDPSWSPAPSLAVTVTANQVTPAAFSYAPAATVNLAAATTNGHPAPPGMPFTVYNTALVSTTHTRPIPAASGGATSITTWPYGDGLTAWAGDCSDADPQAAGGSRQEPFATEPGQTTDAAISAAPVDITVTSRPGAAVSNATVVAVHAPDSGCHGPVADPVDGGTVGEAFTLPTTDSGGVTRVSLPFGTWTIKVSGRRADHRWPTVTLAPDGSTAAVSVVVR